MREYYIHNGTEQEGPLSLDQLQQKSITRQTAIWYEGLPAWTTAEKLPELAGLFRQAPPPFQSVHQPAPESFLPVKSAKKPLIVPLTIIGLVICLGLLGLFVYNNRATAGNLEDVKQAQFAIVENQNKIAEKQIKEEANRLAEEARRKAINEALTKKNREYRNNWSSYIHIGEVYANIDKFWGGIKAFDIPIANETDYMLDEVQVSVRYIKDNGDIYKMETVSIYNIPANSIKTGRAPASPRGTSLDYQIMGIVSKGMHFCFPVRNGNAEDPFFCK